MGIHRVFLIFYEQCYNIDVITSQIVIMKTIESVIKQSKPFKSEKQKALLNIVLTANELMDQMDEYLDGFGLTHKQYNVLRIVRGAKQEVSTLYIKERMLVKNADASRIVDRLVKKNFIDKCANSKDKRLVNLTLSKEGKTLLKKIDKSINIVDELLISLSQEECEQLNFLINKIRS